MTFSWFCQGLLLPLQHHLKVVPFSNIFWGIFTLLSTQMSALMSANVCSLAFSLWLNLHRKKEQNTSKPPPRKEDLPALLRTCVLPL